MPRVLSQIEIENIRKRLGSSATVLLTWEEAEALLSAYPNDVGPSAPMYSEKSHRRYIGFRDKFND